jgi:hypothetical protein
MDALLEYWNSWGLAEKIFWCFSGYFSLLLLIHFFSLIFSRKKTLGNQPEKTPSFFDIFTKRYSIPFFTSFCWTGLAAFYSGIKTPAVLFISALAGIFVISCLKLVLFIQQKNYRDKVKESNAKA